jgi:hypothetical protein
MLFMLQEANEVGHKKANKSDATVDEIQKFNG